MPILKRDGAQIYYESTGAGPAIVFAHGAGGNAAIWFNQIAHFAPHHQVIAFDHRCFGRSSVSEDMTVHHFRDDLLGILDELGVDRAHLVGQSMGGFTVLRTALDAADRVLSLTMSCTSGGIRNPNPTPAMRNLTSSSGRSTDGVLASMSRASAENAALMQLYVSINNFNINFGWEKLRSLLGPEDVVELEQLQSVQCPTLIFAGDEDPLFPPELLQSFVPHFGNAQIEVVKDAGHSPYFETPELFNARLAAHIAAAQ